MSYSEDVERKASKAFVSPSTLAKRLGTRLSPRSHDSGDSHSVAASRRSVSMIKTGEDAEIFEQMSVSTGVRLKNSKKNFKGSESVASAEMSAEEQNSQVEEFIRGVNVAAVRLMQTLSPVIGGATIPHDIPRLQAKDYEFEEEGGLWTFAGTGFVSEYGESKRSIPVADGNHSVATAQRTPLDLHNNDNTFHVLANLIVEFLETKLSQDGNLIVLQPEDRVRMERVLPETVRLDFIDAVRTRLERTPVHAATPLDFITLQCKEFGLNREGRLNPILVAANLEGEASFIPVCSNLVSNTHSMSFDRGLLSFNPTPIVYEEDEPDIRESESKDVDVDQHDPPVISVIEDEPHIRESESKDIDVNHHDPPVINVIEDEPGIRECESKDVDVDQHDPPVTNVLTPVDAGEAFPLGDEKKSINTAISVGAQSVILTSPDNRGVLDSKSEEKAEPITADEKEGHSSHDYDTIENQGGENEPGMVGAYQRYNRSMLSTMTTAEEDDEQYGNGNDENFASGVGLMAASAESRALTPMGVEMTFSETMTLVEKASICGSFGPRHSDASPKGNSFSQQSTSGSHAPLPLPLTKPIKNSDRASCNASDGQATSYTILREQQPGEEMKNYMQRDEDEEKRMSGSVPPFESSVVTGLPLIQSPSMISSEVLSPQSPQSTQTDTIAEGFHSSESSMITTTCDHAVQSPAVTITGVQSVQSHSIATGFGFTVESPTLTTALPDSEIQSDMPWQATEREQFQFVPPRDLKAHEKDRYQFPYPNETPVDCRSPPPDVVILGDEPRAVAAHRPPPHPESAGRPVASTSQFWQVPLTYADHMPPGIASMFSASNTLDSGTNLFTTTNPFASLAVLGRPFAGSPTSESQLFAPSPVSGMRSELQEQLEHKKRDIALKAQLTSDYEQYEQSVVTPNSEARGALGSDPEGLARQQLVAELREASALVAESENPEIAKFWKDHVAHLQNRLRALQGQEIDVSEASVAEIAESNRRLISEIVHREQYLPEEEPSTPMQPPYEELPPLDSSKAEEPSTPMPPPEQANYSHEDAEATFLAEEVGFSGNSSLVDVTSDTAPTNEGITSGFINSDNQLFVTPQHSITEETNALERLPQPHSSHDEKSTATTLPEPNYDLPEPNYDLPMVDVVAPADLPGGYHFEAEIEGKRFLATVPAGGVQQGETFTCYMRDLDSVAIDIPVGYWRDNLLNLFDYGCCHPVIWNSFFCPLIALGQVQHRVGFDFLGRVTTKDKDSLNSESHLSNRAMMMIIILSWAFMNIGIFLGYNWKWSRGLDLTMADMSAMILVNVMMYGFIVFVAQSTRSSLREKFLIREQRCNDLEDICCATMCLPCTVSQMSRHTANYDDYEAVCCSKTGLPDGVRVNESRRDHGTYIV